MTFTVGQEVDVFNPEGEHETELSATVLEVTDDSVIVRPRNKNIPDVLAQLMGLDEMRFVHNLDGTGKEGEDQDVEGWSIKPKADQNEAEKN
jgi:hypothetical protein